MSRPICRSHVSYPISLSMLVLALVAGAPPARAGGWPASASGTWNVCADNICGLLIVTQRDGGQCKPVSGYVFGDFFQGSYCPGSGRLTFFRYCAGGTKEASQFYAAVLSTTQLGQSQRLAGSYATGYGLDNAGELPFAGIKQ